MNKSLAQQQFGPSARAYAECEVHRSGESLARLVAIANPQKTWRALDVATGAGHTAAAFAPHVATVVASDITDEMLRETEQLAKARGLENLSTATAEAGSLPFENGSFDIVTCRLAAHHFASIPRFVNAAHRVLSPSGLLAVVDNVTPDIDFLPEMPADLESETAAAYNEFEMLRDPSHARAFSRTQWRQTVADAGFDVIHESTIEKPMAFGAWVERMRCSPAVIDRLRAVLAGPSHLAHFLQPHTADGELQLTLRELILVARKS